MDKKLLLNTFEPSLLKFKNSHTSGTINAFSSPCIGYLKKGHGNFLYKGKTYNAAEGDILYIAADSRYYSVWTGSPEIEFYSIRFSFASKTGFYDYRFQIVYDFPCTLFDKMYEYHDENPLMSAACFLEILSQMYPRMIKSPHKQSSIITPAIEHIETHYAESFSSEYLAALCNCSESGLFSAFRRVTGVTPIEYKHNILIQHALDMLNTTDMSIEEISSALGFSSSNYFRRVFKNQTGSAPSIFRKK